MSKLTDRAATPSDREYFFYFATIQVRSELRRLLCIVALAVLVVSFHPAALHAQAITVNPVTISMTPGQMASTLTITNQSDNDATYQVRVFSWNQSSNLDELLPTNDLLVSPPIGTIAKNASQVVRIVLKAPPKNREATYRILLDQLPPPAAPGTVRFALRLSIPIFAEPLARTNPHLDWTVERTDSDIYLVATNSEGTKHEKIRNIALTAASGIALQIDDNQSPYILAGATRRWHLLENAGSSIAGTVLRLSALGDSGLTMKELVTGR